MCDLCFNLAVFDMKTGLGCCYVRAKGKDIAYGNENAGVKLLQINSNNACLGYSNGIINGVVSINHPMGGKRTRNGIGLTVKGDVIIAQSGHKATEKEFCEAVNTFVKKRGQSVSLFLLQDGGGSTSEYSGLSRLNFAPEGNRKVANVVCVNFKRTPSISYPIYNGSRGDEALAVQLALGGIEADGIAGAGTKNRIKQFQAAINLPKELQNGVADALSLHYLGFKTLF